MAITTSFLKKLVKEDFPSKDQELVGKIGFILNPVILQITNVLNKGLAINNLSTQIKTLTITVDAKGVPVHPSSFATDLKGKCIALQVGRAQNTTTSTTYPTGAPFISFSENNGQIQVLNITGLTAGDNWNLTLIAYD